MRFAVLADIHGNSLALRAVLADMAAQGVTQAVNLGDLLSGPIDPRGTAELLMTRDFATIRGNHDRAVLTRRPEQMIPTDRVTFDALGSDHLAWLGAVPQTARVMGDVFLCHGTPGSDHTYWLDRVDADGTVRAARLPEVTAELPVPPEHGDAGLYLCAHTHIPRVVHVPGGPMIVNPGSVGCPAYDDDAPVLHVVQTGTPNASYAIIEGDGAARNVTFRSVPYDTEAAAQAAEGYGRPDWAKALRTGWLAE